MDLLGSPLRIVEGLRELSLSWWGRSCICCCCKHKTSELKLAIDSNHPDIIVLTEVTPKNNRYILQKSEIEIKGYNLYISDFEETNTRGVAVYVKKYITSNQVELANAVKDTVWVEITLEKQKK